MRPTETIHVERGMRRWFWVCIAGMVLLIAIAASGIVWMWLAVLTNAELMEGFERSGGIAGVEELTDETLLIWGIEIDANVPRDVWRTAIVRGQPIRITLKGLDISREDWRVVSTSPRITELTFRDCRFDDTVTFSGYSPTLDSLSFLRVNEPGEQLNEGHLVALINSFPSMPGLTRLGIEHSPITDRHVQQIVQNAPLLEQLDLHATSLTSECLLHLRDLENLDWLSIDELPESAIPVVADFTVLKGIAILEDHVGIDGCRAAFDGIPSLKNLQLLNPRLSVDDVVALESAGIGCRILDEFAWLYRLVPEP